MGDGVTNEATPDRTLVQRNRLVAGVLIMLLAALYAIAVTGVIVLN